MTRLEPCPHCHCHVKVDETACPFCASPLAFAPLAPRRRPRAPIGRAALFAFGVLATPACGDDESSPTPDAPLDATIAADAPADAAIPADADSDEPDGSIAIYASAPTTPPKPLTTPEDPNASSSG
jgi:hypothetical protein